MNTRQPTTELIMNMLITNCASTLVTAFLLGSAAGAFAVDTTLPVLTATDTWIAKSGSNYIFNVLLDPHDDQGIQRLEVREKINTTTMPASEPWREAIQDGIGDSTVPWKPEQPLTLGFNCSSMVLQVRAVDTSGNYSEVITRTYKSPFPISNGPSATVRFATTPLNFTGEPLDCRGMFTADFDGNGRDDILTLDRATGAVTIRRQKTDGTFINNGFSVAANTITDGAVADFDGDGKPDIALVADGSVTIYHNDGLNNSDVLTFTASSPAGMGTSGISVAEHIVAGNVTDDDKPDLIVAGRGDDGLGGTNVKIAVLINDFQHYFDASNNAVAPPGASAGRMALGDFDGDGWNELVMIDAANKELVIFKNKQNGSFGGSDDPEPSAQPAILATGDPGRPFPAVSVAVGDVSGDGRADIVVTTHAYFATGPGEYTAFELWQLFENRGSFTFAPTYSQITGRLISGTDLEYQSDVLLQSLTTSRLPQLILTDHFNHGITVIRPQPWLNRQNQMANLLYFDTDIVSVPAANDPQRLTLARFGANSKKDVVVANGNANQLSWLFTMSNITSTKLTDIVGGVSPLSNPDGTSGNNGLRDYSEFVGGTLNYSLTCFNNTTSNLTSATIECLLPPGLEVTSADADYSIAPSGTSSYVRWTQTIEIGTSIVKNFSVRINAATANSILAPKNTLRQGTKSLATSVMPGVKILPVNFMVVPSSFGQTWSFSYKPVTVQATNVSVRVQYSSDGVTWSLLPSGLMSRTTSATPEWKLSSTDVSAGSRFFRALIGTPGQTDGYSSIFKTFLPPTTGLKITTKTPYLTGQLWTFAATQTTTAANASVRFQSTLTPSDEGSWTDLPVYSPITRAANVWTSITYNISSGQRCFRAITAAPGWVDSISAPTMAYNVSASTCILPLFTYFEVEFVDPATSGEDAAFVATTASVPGLKVRFQSKLSSEDDSAWKDLPDGYMSVAGTKWTWHTKYMPVGVRDWRVISQAPGYLDNNTRTLPGGGTGPAFYSFEVLPKPLPQIQTFFGGFDAPTDGGVYHAGAPFDVKMNILDLNGINHAVLEYAQPGGTFKALAGDMVSNGLLTYSKSVTFTGTGKLILRIAVTDKATPAQTCRSGEISISVGPGTGGISAPYQVGNFVNKLTQSTLTTRGSVAIKLKIGDDSQVYRAFLHRTTSDGGYLSTVGEMTRTGTTNPADFSLTDANLSDDTYYYRISAWDYDNNETLFYCTTAYIIATPAPPPSPANLDIAIASRRISPTVPTGKYNHSAIPYPDSGMVVFTYSGLPTGTNRFVAYRTDGDSSHPYWEQTVTKSPGSLKIKAPFWTADKTNPNAGEGTYRIAAFQGSIPIPHGSGTDTFTVGHAWNLPDTFSTLDYGLFWFKDGKNALLGIKDENDDYFDPSKPTVIYVHGWQNNEVSVKRRESWVRQDHAKETVTYDMCKIWKDQGYNVGMFNWNQFADGDLLFSQANIYYIATEDGLPDGHSLIYASNDSSGKSGRHYFVAGEGGDIEGKTVCDIFLTELQRCLSGYVPNTTDHELRFIGHSLGTQVVGRSTWLIKRNPGLGIPLPTRVSLLEIAQINGLGNLPDPYGNTSIPDLQFSYISELIGAGIAIDCYQTTDLQSFLGLDMAFVGDIHNACAYARVRPDYIKPLGVGLSVFQQSHNESVYWYMHSFGFSEFPAYTYWSPFVKRDYVGNALSATTTNARVRSLMGGSVYYEQSEGKNTDVITDDEFEKKTR